ncbi:hypothetical protein ACU8V7_09800 [Zobellia nedashkovskayae]
MKKACKINKVYTILSVLGLVLLLFLSPCKTRNFIQAELGVIQTKVLNKSQSTVSQLDCPSFEVSEIIQTVSKPSFHQPNILTPEVYHFRFAFNWLRHYPIPTSSKEQLVSDVPLYILYQNLKVYS